MKVKEVNPEVFITCEDITKVNAQDLEFLKRKASSNERRRVRLCAHKDIQDQVHEMLIVHSRDAYVRPHKHINKSESLHVIEGRAYAVIFDEAGGISEVIQMGESGSGLTFYYRIAESVYHMLLITSDFFVFHEAVQGPFDKSKNIFASWSPEEGNSDAVNVFKRNLEKKLDVKEVR